MIIEIDGVQVIADEVFDLDELKYFLEVARSKVKGGEVSQLTCSLEADGRVRIDYVYHGQKFERIRRITGYLVGTTDRWNDAKQAEEQDRVKHG